MKKDGLKLLTFFSVMLLALSAVVYAVDKEDAVSGAAITEGPSGTLTETSSGSDDAQGGNVTEINLTTTSSTVKWQGYFGQVTAALKLGIGSDILFNFGSVPNGQIKTVLASPDSSFDFSSLQAASVNDVDTAWSFTTTDADSATSTLTGSATIAQVASVPTASLNAYNSTGSLKTDIYSSGALADTGSPSAVTDFAFGVSIDANQRDFRNTTVVDYELIVPVNTSGVAGTQTYFFFLDIE